MSAISPMTTLEPEFARRPAPVFRFVCPAGCHAGTEAQCRAVLRTAIRDAIALAEHAAGRLEESPRSGATVTMFRAVFGHPPGRAVPWGGGRDSGGIVARRYRLAVAALQSRGTRYECGNTPFAALAVTPARVVIGPSFWTQGRRHRGAIILHEMMHQYFLRVRHDDREHRRNNAYCLEVFALRASGYAVPASDVLACRGRPA